MSDLLEGWANPIQALPALDHTFVKAPNNGPAYFDCFGGHEDPAQHLVSGATGDGHYSIADCYRESHILPDTAGLIYGITGVCHQAANRFLYSSWPWFGRPIVVTDPFKGVRGSILSVALYGTLGVDVGIFLITYAACYFSCTGERLENLATPMPNSNPVGYDEELGSLLAGYIDNVRNGVNLDPFEPIRAEFDLGVKHVLGEEFVTDKMAELHQALLREKDEIVAANVRGEDLAHRMNDAVNRYLRQLATHLGSDAYRKLIGFDPDVYIVVVDPEIAVRN
jgi:hypothetical protein